MLAMAQSLPMHYAGGAFRQFVSREEEIVVCN